MVLERLFASDFTPRTVFREAEDSTLPEAWPVSYDEMRPWYVEAEKLYRVRGSSDPLRPDDDTAHLLPSKGMTGANQELFDFFGRQGLHPYALHMACDQSDNCVCCQAVLCERDCKNHSGRNCVAPALAQHGATLLTECTALMVNANRTRVTSLVCRWKARTITLKGRFFILAAGAMATPSLLLNSTSAEWPSGIANRSGMVGRNLMRHMVDLYLVTPRSGDGTNGRMKQLALSDFYCYEGKRYGVVESFGELPTITHAMNTPDPGPIRKLLRLGRPVLSPLWDNFRSRKVALAGIMEDLPYYENRVLPPLISNGTYRIRFQYQTHGNEIQRVREFRSLLRSVLRPYRAIMMKGAHLNKALGHVCGTCRFGVNPQISVLDPVNRAHDLSNLYVCDASFFPSSGGTNPALSIAANALRVAAHLLDRF
jgi:choline dehydrogenase-like flavoprotein